MISNKLSILAIGYNYLEINEIQDQLTASLSKFHFDFAISVRDSFYRLNIKNYEIILLDVASTNINALFALQEMYQKNDAIPTIVTAEADRISDLSALLGAGSHFFVPKDAFFAEGIGRCVQAIIRRQRKEAKESLQQNFETPPLVKELINAMHDMVAIVGLDCRLKLVNQKFLEKYNCTAEDVVGKFCYQIFYYLDKPCPENSISCPIQKIKRLQKSCELVHTKHEPEKNLIYQAHISAFPLENKSGKLENVLIAIKEERIPVATQFDKTLLEELINGLTEGLIFCDINNRIVLMNKAAEKFLCVNHKHLTNKSVFELPLNKGIAWLGGILNRNGSENMLSRSEKFMIQDKWLNLRFVPLHDQNSKYLGGFLYLSEKILESRYSFDPDLITVSRMFSSKIVAEG